ncbi:MAG TPA: conjugal transfer protein TraD [Sphingomonas sp.]|nr:conjugal transfer protein TraD [Sphingomonas sp.]
MRKVRDYDAELKALGDKARALKAKRVEQLGQLVTATGADALDAETLAGVLLDAIGSTDVSVKEAWRAKGAAFFQRRGRKGGGAAAIDGSGAATQSRGDATDGSGATANG